MGATERGVMGWRNIIAVIPGAGVTVGQGYVDPEADTDYVGLGLGIGEWAARGYLAVPVLFPLMG